MPPSLPQDRESNLVKSSEPYYTNEDVAILHDVVVYAQELLPSLPERERVPTNALFHAYYALLPSVGINADHDSRYARVLFKIGGVRSNGSLYEKFETVLARMGIEIQFDQDNTLDEREVTKELRPTQSIESQQHVAPNSGIEDHERGRRRRNSEGSALGIGLGVSGGTTPRPKPRSSLSRPRHASIADRPAAGLYVSQTSQQAMDHIYQAGSGDGVAHQKDHGLRVWLKDDAKISIQDPRARSTSAHRGIQVRRSSPRTNDQLPATNSTLPAYGDVHTTGDPPYPEAEEKEQSDWRIQEPDHPPLPITSSETLMNVKITLIEQFRWGNLLRRIWQRWRQKAAQLREDNSNLNIVARHRDKQILIRQAIESWRTSLMERRQNIETERFFAHLESRAARARDLFLLTKALSHWTYSASYELQRTAVARRHILRVRYFNAWLEITAVNELKVRRQVIRKFFNIWQARRIGKMRMIQDATRTWRTRLMKTVLSTWFWDFCERRAPARWAYRLQRRQLAIWHRLSNTRRINEEDAIDYFGRGTKQKLLSVWRAKTRHSITNTDQAKNHRAWYISHKSLVEWHRSSVLLPLQRMTNAKNGSRLKLGSFKQWLLRARHNRDAAVIDRLKIMREAWVLWNDKIRTITLQSRIGDRVMVRGLYKWVLAERLLLVKRILEKKAKRILLQKMVETQRMLRDKDARQFPSAQQKINHKTMNKALQIWRDYGQVRLRHQHIASGFDSPRALSVALSKWLDRTRQTGQLRKWAHDGEFYFLSSKAIKRWKQAVEGIKRDKIRNAYAQFRRKIKVSLATRMFSSWGAHAVARTGTTRLVAEVRDNKNAILCIEIFDRWRGRTEEVLEMRLTTHMALLRKHLNEMRITLRTHLRAQVDAAEFLEDHLSALSLKKWSRFALQLRLRQHSVLALREKHLKKSSRKILAHWRQRTPQGPSRYDDVGRKGPGNDRHKRSGVLFAERSMLSSEAANLEAVAQGVGLHGAALSLQIPGYLSTPSRKTSRNRAIAGISSTTPSAPLSTPAEMHLRAQYSGGPLSSFRMALAKNSRSAKGAFAHKVEETAESQSRIQVRFGV